MWKVVDNKNAFLCIKVLAIDFNTKLKLFIGHSPN